ncbi:mitogen-activated protein kinase kinase kinase, partial [Marasmius crinis-equi]
EDRASTSQGTRTPSGYPCYPPKGSQLGNPCGSVIGRPGDELPDSAYRYLHDHQHLQSSQPWIGPQGSSWNGQGGSIGRQDEEFPVQNDYRHSNAPPTQRSASYGTPNLDTYDYPPRQNMYDVHNRGNYNRTYNDSLVHNGRKTDKRSYNGAVVYVSVHEAEKYIVQSLSGSSGSTHSSRSSLPSVGPNPAPSLHTSSSRSPDIPLRPPVESTRGEMTQSQLYESLLLGCRLGYPLWEPSPRRTPVGEYTLDIGDVGVFSDGLPFYMFFNITQPSDSPANKDGIPEGVDPPCVIQPRWLTVKEKYHERDKMFIQPRGSISQKRVINQDGSRVFTFNLSQHEGALLTLPQGGTLKILERVDEFKRRIQRYWRQWYIFADDQRDLEQSRQVLYVVTGVEKCSMWAMAVWDSTSSYVCDDASSLELSVDESSGSCCWSFPPARCATQSSETLPPSEDNALNQSVFVRGFWINRSNGTIDSKPPPLHSGGHRDGQDPEGGSDAGHEGNGEGDKPSRYSGHGSSSSNSLSSGRFPSTHGGPSESPGVLTDSAVSLAGLQVDELNLGISANDLNGDDYPCQVINNFALALISKACPALFDAGCIAFSHDNDWMGIVEDSETVLSEKTQFVRQFCSKFKFVVEQDAIYPASMSDRDERLVRHSLSSPQNIVKRAEGAIVALIEFREPQFTQGHEAQSPTSVFRTVDSNHPELLSPSFPIPIEDMAKEIEMRRTIPDQTGHVTGTNTALSEDPRPSHHDDTMRPCPPTSLSSAEGNTHRKANTSVEGGQQVDVQRVSLQQQQDNTALSSQPPPLSSLQGSRQPRSRPNSTDGSPSDPPPMSERAAARHRRPADTVNNKTIILVTADSSLYANVEITGATNAAFIREKIFTALNIFNDEDQSLFSIYRTEIGQYAIGDALTDDRLYEICRASGDSKGSLKLLVSHTSATVHDPNYRPPIQPAHSITPPVLPQYTPATNTQPQAPIPLQPGGQSRKSKDDLMFTASLSNAGTINHPMTLPGSRSTGRSRRNALGIPPNNQLPSSPNGLENMNSASSTMMRPVRPLPVQGRPSHSASMDFTPRTNSRSISSTLSPNQEPDPRPLSAMGHDTATSPVQKRRPRSYQPSTAFSGDSTDSLRSRRALFPTQHLPPPSPFTSRSTPTLLERPTPLPTPPPNSSPPRSPTSPKSLPQYPLDRLVSSTSETSSTASPPSAPASESGESTLKGGTNWLAKLFESSGGLGTVIPPPISTTHLKPPLSPIPVAPESVLDWYCESILDWNCESVLDWYWWRSDPLTE